MMSVDVSAPSLMQITGNYTLFSLPCRNLDYEIVIIDDNSPDGTQEVVKRLQTAYSSDRIVSLQA